MESDKFKAYEAERKVRLQQFRAELEAELSKPKQVPDPYRVARRRLTMELYQARLRQGLSQAELAAKIGTSQPVIARAESGKGNPSLQTLLAMAAALNRQLVLE
jgi:ribosome-binding protein aMBF1 (putative translation factor)